MTEESPSLRRLKNPRGLEFVLVGGKIVNSEPALTQKAPEKKTVKPKTHKPPQPINPTNPTNSTESYQILENSAKPMKPSNTTYKPETLGPPEERAQLACVRRGGGGASKTL